MPNITVVGLGPGNPQHLTCAAVDALRQSQCLILRTAHHKVANWLTQQHIPFTTLDSLYETADDFNVLNEAITNHLLNAAESVTYAVPGHGLIGDDTVAALIAKQPVQIIPGLPDIAMAFTSACANPSEGCAWLPASAITTLRPDTTRPLLITEIDGQMLAAEMKLILLDYYPPQCQVTVFHDGIPTMMPLEDCDRLPRYDHSSMLLLPALPFDALQRYTAQDLSVLMKRLLAPGGCEWDRAQTFASVRTDLIDEAYEAVQAIDEGDMEGFCDELGDVLLMIMFNACLAEEHGAFAWNDVTTAICQKLVRRHPQIFAGAVANNAEEGLALWDEVKAKEKAARGESDSIAAVMRKKPGAALMRADSVARQAAKVGFDFTDAKNAFEKLREEVAELEAELREGGDVARQTDELGDVLFAAVNVARLCGISAEMALLETVERFIRRFAYVEQCVVADGGWEGKGMTTLDEYWNDAKKRDVGTKK